MQSQFIDFLTTRRSVTAKTMAPGKVDPNHLDQILTAGMATRANTKSFLPQTSK